MMNPTTKIAGKKTVADWQQLKSKLLVEGEAEPWKEAFEDFFHERLKTRYFVPLQVLENMPDKNGEGFSIVAIQCSLIEFLASTVEGKSYRYWRKGDPPLGKFEYANSGDMFRALLTNHVPFKEMFADQAAANDFYSNVRCGLLHEARTKGTWRITVSKSAPKAIDTHSKIVYRNMMQDAFCQFTQWYRDQIHHRVELQQAFIRKFDSLCED